MNKPFMLCVILPLLIIAIGFVLAGCLHSYFLPRPPQVVEPTYIDANTGNLLPLLLKDRPPILVPCAEDDGKVKGWCGVIKFGPGQKAEDIHEYDYVFLMDKGDL